MVPPRVPDKSVSKVIGKTAPSGVAPLRRRREQAEVKVRTEVRPVHAQEVDQALGLYFTDSQARGRDVRDRVESFKQLAQVENYDLTRQIVGLFDNKIQSSCLFVPQPGRNAFIFISRSAQGAGPDSSELAVRAIRRACQWAFQEGSILLQVMIEPADDARRDLCLRCGFRQLTDLIYMFCPQESLPSRLAAPEGLVWLCYEQKHHELFKNVMARTYQGSRDCPELEELRDMEDVIRSHQGAGQFDRRLWKLLVLNDKPAGVLLQTPLRTPETMELTYMGLVPEARGQNLGKQLLQEARYCASECQRSLTLAVDCRNLPALGLYGKFGFEVIFRRTVMIRSARRP